MGAHWHCRAILAAAAVMETGSNRRPNGPLSEFRLTLYMSTQLSLYVLLLTSRSKNVDPRQCGQPLFTRGAANWHHCGTPLRDACKAVKACHANNSHSVFKLFIPLKPIIRLNSNSVRKTRRMPISKDTRFRLVHSEENSKTGMCLPRFKGLKVA